MLSRQEKVRAERRKKIRALRAWMIVRSLRGRENLLSYHKVVAAGRANMVQGL
jgi:hypothetical protein